MANFAEVEGLPADAVGPGGASVVLGWAGALMSVALVAGLGVWGYKLAVRDVTGVPVVRALEGPMRIQPEDPGGAQPAHQGLAVNAVAAEGTAAAPADRLVLAPAPLDLSEEDQPRASLGAELAEAAPAARPSLPAGTDAILSLADTIAEGAQPLEIAPPQAELAENALEGIAPVVAAIPADIGGLARSPWPAPRPAGDVMALAVASEVALAVSRPSAALDVDPSTVPAGTRLVQFGAFDTPEQARNAWAGLQDKFGDFLQGKQRIVQEAVSGGKTFYRLRAMGFADIGDARRFCAAIVAERQACIPVVVR